MTGTSIALFANANAGGGTATALGAIGAGGNAGTIALTATGGDVALQSTTSPAASISVRATGGSSGSANGGTGKAVTINATGNVTITGSISTVGGNPGGTGVGGNGGAVTVSAGGAVAIGANITLITRYNNNELQLTSASIATRGGDTGASTASPGNGGVVMISGTGITLPFGVTSRGGEADDTVSSAQNPVAWASTAVTGWLGASTANGGDAGSIALTSSGAITVGNPAGSSTTSTGSLVGLFANGGISTGGSGGNGAAITVTGGTVSTARIYATGGDTFAAATGGSGAAISSRRRTVSPATSRSTATRTHRPEPRRASRAR